MDVTGIHIVNIGYWRCFLGRKILKRKGKPENAKEKERYMEKENWKGKIYAKESNKDQKTAWVEKYNF